MQQQDFRTARLRISMVSNKRSISGSAPRLLTIGLVGTALLLVTLAAPRVRAQQFTFKAYDGTNEENLSDVDFAKFFNMARCLCDQDSPGPTYSFYVTVSSPGPYEDKEVYFLLGDNCDQDVSRPNCHEFDSINYSNFNREQKVYLPLNWIVSPTTGTCGQARDTSTLYLFMTPEKTSSVATYPIDFDTKSPGSPTVTSAEGGDGAILVKWDRPDTDDEDIKYFDILCEIDGAAPDSASASKADWVSTEKVCGKILTPEDSVPPGGEPDLDGGLDAAVDAGSDAAVTDGAPPPPAGDGGTDDARTDAGVDATSNQDAASQSGCYGTLTEGDWPRPCFVCGSTGPTASEYRISGLPNGVEVQVAVVAVDNNGNPSTISNVETAEPMPTEDFAEHYSNAGGGGDGGFCFVATTAYGSYDHPNVRILRRFRDRVLAQHGWGRRFIQWYYANGRTLAAPFQGRPWARVLLRAALFPLVVLAWIWVNLGGALLFFLTICLMAGLFFLLRRRRRLAPAAVRSQRDSTNEGHNRF